MPSSANLISLYIPELPNLPEHQQHAQKEGQYWLKTVVPACSKTTLDIVNYAKNFRATYKELVKLVDSKPKDLNSHTLKNCGMTRVQKEMQRITLVYW